VPIYQYQCSTCNHVFDKKLSIADRRVPETEPCPNCNEVTVQKNDGNSNEHTYGLGAEAKNNYGGFSEVLTKIHDQTKHMGGKLKDQIKR
jgi:putative FmdB family regulatory protein